uniref:Uncharacterized protein n=1 Tax=Anguilla anguilla TaxID=7936 RepID=A0A0E9T3E3_ANGAN
MRRKVTTNTPQPCQRSILFKVTIQSCGMMM